MGFIEMVMMSYTMLAILAAENRGTFLSVSLDGYEIRFKFRYVSS